MDSVSEKLFLSTEVVGLMLDLIAPSSLATFGVSIGASLGPAGAVAGGIIGKATGSAIGSITKKILYGDM